MSLRNDIRKVTQAMSLGAWPSAFKEDPVKKLHSLLCQGPLTVVQVGANGATTEDPLIGAIECNPDLKAYLIEPLLHYCNLLQSTHQTRIDRVKIVNAAISNKREKKEFFYIHNAVADEMDGEGPYNRWAHGQGSFDKETIIHWIKQNEFRGSHYRANIEKYIAAIQCNNIETRTLGDITHEFHIKDIDALIVDVQGQPIFFMKTTLATKATRYPDS